MEPEDELNATTFQTYLFLVKVGRAVGPREVMRGASLTSPSVAYRNLQKLLDLGLVLKDEYGDYVLKEKKSIKGYMWLGKTLIPRSAVFGFIFVGVLTAELAVLFYHLMARASIQDSFWLLTIITTVSAAVFLIEGLRGRKKPKHNQLRVT